MSRKETSDDAWDGLLDEHRRWLAGRGLAPDDWVAHQMLHFKQHYLGTPLHRWRATDLHEIFLGIFPRKVVVEAADIDDVLPQAEEFLEFLHQTGRLARGSDPMPRLLAELERVRAPFAERMRDVGSFGIAKTMASAMAGEGVDLTDHAAVDAWVQEFNERSSEERELLLPGPHVGGELPPMSLPDDGVLAAQALDTPMMRQLVTFVDWVGDGRALTQKGNLRLADGKELVGLLHTDDRFDETIGDRTFKTHTTAALPGVDLAFRLALKARFVRKDRGTVKRAKRGVRVAKEPLEAWRDAISAMFDLGLITTGREDHYGLRWWASDVESGVPVLLGTAAIAAQRVSVAFLTEAAYQWLSETYDLESLPESPRRMLPTSVTRGVQELVDRLEWLGLVSWEGAAVETVLGGCKRRSGGEIELTDLGRWFTRPLLQEQGYKVPRIGDLVDASAADLLDTIGYWPGEAADAELRAWSAARDDAVTQLAAAARDAGTLDRRAFAFHGFDAFGAQAEPAVRTLLDHPQCRSLAALWLVGHGFEEPDFLDPQDAAIAFVQTLAVALSAGGPQAVQEAFGVHADIDQQVAVLEGLWRVDDPHTEAVLEALSAAPERRIAKAARKALFKRCTSG